MVVVAVEETVGDDLPHLRRMPVISMFRRLYHTVPLSASVRHAASCNIRELFISSEFICESRQAFTVPRHT